jgi:hypothetical protein
MGLKRRLRRLEEGRAMREQTPSAAEERRRLVREQVEHVSTAAGAGTSSPSSR